MAEVIFHPAYESYNFGPEHPFSPLRGGMVLDLLQCLGHGVEPVAPPPATLEEVLAVHDEAYVKAVCALSEDAGALDGEPFGLGTADNPIFPGLDLAGRWHVGGTLHAARLLADGERSKILQLGGGLHHARRARASGFCVYSDLAVAIRHLTQRGLYVAYLDIDVHHGDGVQDFFYDDDKVLTMSLHESGQYLFPGTGDVHELGNGSARGSKVNVPFEPLTEGESYLEAFERVVPQALQWFRPGALIVQAGSDAHFDDPLADLLLTTQTYERLFRLILHYADEYAGGKVIFTLGGGYSLRASPRIWAILYLLINGLEMPEALPEEWRSRWAARVGHELPARLHDPNPAYPAVERRDEITRRNRQVVDRLLEATFRHWF